MFSNQSRALLPLVRFELDSWGSDENDNTSGMLDDEYLSHLASEADCLKNRGRVCLAQDVEQVDL